MNKTRYGPEWLRHSGLLLFGDRPGMQSRIADLVGCDKASVSRWLGGNVRVPEHVTTIIRYALKYGLPENALKDEEPSNDDYGTSLDTQVDI